MIEYINGLGETKYQPSLPDGDALWVSNTGVSMKWQEQADYFHPKPRLASKRHAKRIERDTLRYLASVDWRRVE